MNWFERLLLAILPHFDIVKTITCPYCDGTGADLSWTEPPPCECCDGKGKIVTLYLRRFYIWRSSWIGKNFGDLYLHKIYRSDDDPDPHDHPWNFRTFVLWGGYLNETWDFAHCGCGGDHGVRYRTTENDERVSAPATRYREANHIHRVILKDDKPAWTLVWTSEYRRDEQGNADWVFVTKDRMVPWREYLHLDSGEEHGG